MSLKLRQSDKEDLMKMRHKRSFLIGIPILIVILILTLKAQNNTDKQTLDERVKAFLEKHRSDWYDMNIPMRDGQLLYDLIVEHNSTGHSGIWIAWALSKTGGKLITIEINEGRHKEALENFKQAGVSEFIDARLADAHQLVKELEGPFDFIFSDADKGWYKQYFIDVAPKMTIGGCFTAHNISMRGRGIREFVDHIQNLPNFETTIENSRSTGISISYKKAEE
jgi:caffeoyl-CoA O-methyltransferase